MLELKKVKEEESGGEAVEVELKNVYSPFFSLGGCLPHFESCSFYIFSKLFCAF